MGLTPTRALCLGFFSKVKAQLREYVARGRSFADYIRRLLYELNHLKLYRVSIHARVAGVLH